MSGANLQHLLAMVLYMAAVVGIGIYFAGRANKDAESYFLGGRSLGPWVTAFSAEASDMSGYLLMGLPGLAYWTGLADAGWTCIGLAIGTYLNFLIVSKRLRRYSIAVNAYHTDILQLLVRERAGTENSKKYSWSTSQCLTTSRFKWLHSAKSSRCVQAPKSYST